MEKDNQRSRGKGNPTSHKLQMTNNKPSTVIVTLHYAILYENIRKESQEVHIHMDGKYLNNIFYRI